MSFRTIVVTNAATLKYSAGYLIIRQDKINKIHISEIDVLILESNLITFSTYMVNELVKNKVCFIICDELHNPHAQFNSYNGSHDSFAKIETQINWNKSIAQLVWTEIVKQKISNQAMLLLNKCKESASNQLMTYINEVELNDITNREGHAAKVYFNSLFGKGFTRDKDIALNWSLDYGYSLILALFNRTIVSKGYLTQLGINHIGKTNPFNFSCDLMEPFRPVIDYIVSTNNFSEFNAFEKRKVLSVFDYKILIDGKQQFLSYAIDVYLVSIFKVLNTGDLEQLRFPILENEWL